MSAPRICSRDSVEEYSRCFSLLNGHSQVGSRNDNPTGPQLVQLYSQHRVLHSHGRSYVLNVTHEPRS